MNQEMLNPIWGTPFGVLNEEILKPRVNTPIARQLHTFLQRQISEWRPDLIIVIERKGTAILRALKEWNEDPFDWPWEKVISSEIIDQVPNEFFEGKRILIFDDTMKTGYHLQELLSKLKQRGLRERDDDRVRVAVFAIHEDSLNGLRFQNEDFPLAWFYRGLTTTSYQGVREQIVRMLQQAGSLMLDTEHIEVRLRLHGSFNKFVQALQRNSHAVVFRSTEGRTNITVLYGDNEAHTLPADKFPRETLSSKIVKKCRIVQRDTDEFAIIPICFPSVPYKTEGWSLCENDYKLLGTGFNADYKAIFYNVGLIAALKVLHWVLKDLAIWGTDNFSLSLPHPPEDTMVREGYDLGHLRVMFPTLNIDYLTERIAEVEQSARSEGNKLRAHKFEAQKTPVYTDEELRRDAICLLGAVRYVIDQRTVAAGWSKGWQNAQPEGLCLGEIFNLGKNFGWSDERISTLFDILIDEASFATDVEPLIDEDGIKRIVRTFAPAGELISDLVRRYTTQWGLPHGL